jgi:hypothetical protein
VWYQTNAPNPFDVVASVVPGYYYLCPDIESLDAHLAELARALGPRSNLAEKRRRQLRVDIDRLLDRRAYLEMCPAADAA